MNMAELGLQTNAQHRIDQATGRWTASGTGSKRVHRSFSGWELRKEPNTGRWTAWRPDGTQYRPSPAGLCQSFYNLAEAKRQADLAGAQGLDEA